MLLGLALVLSLAAAPQRVPRFALASIEQGAPQTGPKIRLRVGESKVVHPPFAVTEISVTGVTIYDVKLEGKTRLRVTGHAPGKSTLIVFGSHGRRMYYPLEVVASP